MMKHEHYSLRLRGDNQGKGLLSDVITEPISAMLTKSFNPYHNYKLEYQAWFSSIFSPDEPLSAASPAYLGAMSFHKKVNNEISVYTMERTMHGGENKGAKVNPASVTRYSHHAYNDVYCTIPPGSVMDCQYRVIRNNCNAELAGIYQSAQAEPVESMGIDPSGGTRLTNLSIIDVVQKLSCSDEFNHVPVYFDYLENMEYVKPGHCLSYMDTIQAQFGNKSLLLKGFCQIGAGTLPTFYWAVETGMLVYIRHGIYFWALAGGEGLS